MFTTDMYSSYGNIQYWITEVYVVFKLKIQN